MTGVPLMLDLVVPVFNEERVLDAAVRELHRTLSSTISLPWQITIADNASTDETPEIARSLSVEFAEVQYMHLEAKGRGRALKVAWLASEAQVLAYVDVDLSTDLRALLPLIAPLLSGHSDIAIGTRLAPASRVVRGPKREFVSRAYNLLLRNTMGVTFSDAQCGFKAMRREVARQVLPHVQDTGWFFDTELLVIAERAGLRIHEVPVDWVDDEDSSVDVVQTAIRDLQGMVRVMISIATGRIPLESIYAELGRQPLPSHRTPSFFGQVVRFLIVGGLSTVAFAVLYLALSAVLPAQLTNFMALLTTTIANTAVNRAFTFGIRGRRGVVRHQFQGLVVFGIAWGLTSGSLALLHWFVAHPSSTVALLTLTGANLLATVVRFFLLRHWVFRVGSGSREQLTKREATLAGERTT